MLFIQDRATLLKTSFSKEHARLKAEKKTTVSTVTSDEKKKTAPKTLATSTPVQENTSKSKTAESTSFQPRKLHCAICEQEHYVNQCDKFKEMTVDNRKKAAYENRLCFNCLLRGNSSHRCRNRYRCKECKKNHHTLLHKDVEDKPPEKPPENTNITPMCAMNNNAALFPIVAVVVRANGREIRTRAVLDQCS